MVIINIDLREYSCCMNVFTYILYCACKWVLCLVCIVYLLLVKFVLANKRFSYLFIQIVLLISPIAFCKIKII